MQGTGQVSSNTLRCRSTCRFLRKSIRNSTISAPPKTARSISFSASSTLDAITLVVSAHLSPPKCFCGKARNGLFKRRGRHGALFVWERIAVGNGGNA